MRILVTGGTGFVGSHTARALARAGYALRLLVRDRAKAQRTLGAHGVDISDCRVGDVTDPAAVAAALDGCEGVVHAAAVVSFEHSRSAQVLDTNARAAELVLEGARRHGLRSIVYVSSLSVLFRATGPTAGTSPRVTRASLVGPLRGMPEPKQESLRAMRRAGA